MRASLFPAGRTTWAAMSLLFLMSALLSSPPLAARDQAEPPPQPAWDMIKFEVLSWGGPVTWWQFTPEYGGVWAENVSDPNTYNASITFAFHTLDENPEGFAALAELMRRLPDPPPDSDQCANMMTDQPYGTIRLTRGPVTTEIAWNAGCLDDDYAAFMAVLREADELVSGWGRAAPVNRTEEQAR